MTDFEPTDEERQLFRDMVGEVTPVPDSQRAELETPRPDPAPSQHLADERQVMEELLDLPDDPEQFVTGEELEFLRDGLQRRVLRQLKRGHYSVGDELDLHHMNQEAARNSILHFIEEATRAGASCIKIIHGKGLRSRPGGPRLKSLTDHILRRHPAVMAFASAPRHDGGTGAVRVLLKRSPRRRKPG